MVRLASTSKMFNKVFYFHNMKDCNEFIYVFKDHFCNIEWSEPKEFPDNSILLSSEREAMDIPPKERAERNLKWGFNAINKSDCQVKINTEQKKFVYDMVERITNGK